MIVPTALAVVCLASLQQNGVTAFVPTAFTRTAILPKNSGGFPNRDVYQRRQSPLNMVVDPSSLFHFDGLHQAFSSLLLSDASVVDVVSDATNAVADVISSNVAEITSNNAVADVISSNVAEITSNNVPETVSSAANSLTDAASKAVSTETVTEVATPDPNGGPFGFLTAPIASLLQGIHSALIFLGVGANSWGISIIVLTVLIKVFTYPLTKQQLDSTNKMQALQPKIKEIQTKYQSNPEVMNQKIAEEYQKNNVNPLAGCIPSLVQIPIFIGLYRAVLNLAQDDKISEPFLWLPNLEGPTFDADPTHGTDWLFQGWQNGAPSLGWSDTLAYLTIPIFLIVSQYVSMNLMQPKTPDGQPQPQQGGWILKVLPIMVGWFALNVPSALGVYWAINNIITTAISLQIRNAFQSKGQVVTPGSQVIDVEPTKFVPSSLGEKPQGFGSTSVDDDDDDDDDDDVKPITSTEATSGDDSKLKSKKRGKKKKRKN